MQDKKIHFIGIGGIGMSALAQWYQHQRWDVSGSDSEKSIITDDLKKVGIKVGISARPFSNSRELENVDLVVYSAAVPKNHPEREKSEKLEIKQLSYPEALGQLVKHKKTVAICGTHGKSTTTAMTALILIKAKFDPTVIIGTRIPQLKNNNFRYGKSDWLIIEADEYKGAFLNYKPYAVICTNVEADHLDYYKNYNNVKKAFKKFFDNISKGGHLVLNSEDNFLNKVKPRADLKAKFFGATEHSNIRKNVGVSARAKELAKLLKVPGHYNLMNALAADTLAASLGIKKEVRNKALSEFKGTWRRFEYKGKFQGARVYDDYAHHPTEIKAVLQGAREKYPQERIWCAHQPHQTSRLQSLFGKFTRSFKKADRVIILETYKVQGREQDKIIHGKTAKSLALKVSAYTPAAYAKNQKEAVDLLKSEVKAGDIVLITGAGDITEVAKKLTHDQ